MTRNRVNMDPEVLRKALSDAWPKALTAKELCAITGYPARSVSSLLGPCGRALNIEHAKIPTLSRGEKILTYRLPSKDSPLEVRPLKPSYIKKPRPERPAKPQIPAKPGKGVPFLKETAHSDDPVKALPPPTRRAVEYLRRDGWCVWPRGGGWQCGHLVLAEQELVDLAERRQARAGG